jgi:hypothetical protein
MPQSADDLWRNGGGEGKQELNLLASLIGPVGGKADNFKLNIHDLFAGGPELDPRYACGALRANPGSTPKEDPQEMASTRPVYSRTARTEFHAARCSQGGPQRCAHSRRRVSALIARGGIPHTPYKCMTCAHCLGAAGVVETIRPLLQSSHTGRSTRGCK